MPDEKPDEHPDERCRRAGCEQHPYNPECVYCCRRYYQLLIDECFVARHTFAQQQRELRAAQALARSSEAEVSALKADNAQLRLSVFDWLKIADLRGQQFVALTATLHSLHDNAMSIARGSDPAMLLRYVNKVVSTAEPLPEIIRCTLTENGVRCFRPDGHTGVTTVEGFDPDGHDFACTAPDSFTPAQWAQADEYAAARTPAAIEALDPA